MTDEPKGKASRWAAAWPDAVGFASGLAMAWYFQWQTTDLVWSLWLSSLLVGYAMIVWMIFGRIIVGLVRAGQDPGLVITAPSGKVMLGGGALLLGGLFLLAFFTVHFGGFHFVHSVFLSLFFPLQPGMGKNFPGYSLYLEVFARYWWFVPVAALAERSAFRLEPENAVPDTAVTVEAIAARKARNAAQGLSGGMMAPYKNVIRLHLLIFFFAGAHFAKLDSFLVYAVVYAVYFFPWRLLKAEPVPATG